MVSTLDSRPGELNPPGFEAGQPVVLFYFLGSPHPRSKYINGIGEMLGKLDKVLGGRTVICDGPSGSSDTVEIR